MRRPTQEELNTVGAARAALAAVHLEQAELAKLLAYFVACDHSPVAVKLLCREVRRTLASEDQAAAKLADLEKTNGPREP